MTIPVSQAIHVIRQWPAQHLVIADNETLRKKLMSKFTRREVWQHNGLRGSVAMSKAQMRKIITSKTATATAKGLAAEIEFQLSVLQTHLKERAE